MIAAADGDHDHRPGEQRQAQRLQHTAGDIGITPLLVRPEVGTAVAQTRMVARLLQAAVAAAHFDRFLGVRARRQRRRVGLLVARAQRRQQRVEQRQHLDRVHRRLRRRPLPAVGRQTRSIMQRIEQTDGGES